METKINLPGLSSTIGIIKKKLTHHVVPSTQINLELTYFACRILLPKSSNLISTSMVLLREN